jgi:transcriptional regulator GlxA family with amidase domain
MMDAMIPHTTFVKLCRARDLLRDCLGEPIALADAAAEADLSAWHFLRLFRHTFGETPHQFLTRLRIERAKDLLTVSGRSVTDICFDVGFSSLGSFSTLFARHVGASPIIFRRRMRTLVVTPGVHPWGVVPCCFAFMLGGQIPPGRNIREALTAAIRVH